MDITLHIANSMIRVPVSDTGLTTDIDLNKIPAEVLSIAMVNGLIGALNNIARSNGKGEEPKTDKQWAKARADKVAVWEAGSWASHGGGGERDTLPMRDAFYAERGAVDSKARKALDKAIQSKVRDTYGDGESATFARFLDAVAKELGAGDATEAASIREKLEAKYTKLALDLVKERSKATATLDIGSML